MLCVSKYFVARAKPPSKSIMLLLAAVVPPKCLGIIVQKWCSCASFWSLTVMLSPQPEIVQGHRVTLSRSSILSRLELTGNASVACEQLQGKSILLPFAV